MILPSHIQPRETFSRTLGAAAPPDYSLPATRYSLLGGGSPAAFTLVELLFVIAIVGILTAIAVPVSFKVLGSARDSQCRTNLRQLHTGIMGYAADTGKLPQRYGKSEAEDKTENDDLDDATNNPNWYRNVYYYLSLRVKSAGETWPDTTMVKASGGKALGIFMCPSDSRKTTPPTNSAATKSNDDVLLNSPSYGYNERLYNSLPGNSTTTRQNTTRPNEITKNCILLIDCLADHATPTTQTNLNLFVRYRHLCRSDYDFDAAKSTPATNGNSANAIMWDGTVRQFKQGELPYVGQTLGPLNGTQLWMPW